MEVIEITPDNSRDFASLLPEDISENIGRQYFRGRALLDEQHNTDSCLVWEYQHVNSDEGKTARILHFDVKDPEGGNLLFEAFEKVSTDDGAGKAVFEFSNTRSKEIAFFGEKGYSVEVRRSRDVYLSLEDISQQLLNMEYTQKIQVMCPP